MRKPLSPLAAVLAALALLSACVSPQPSPTATPTPLTSPTTAPSATPVPSGTPSPLPTAPGTPPQPLTPSPAPTISPSPTTPSSLVPNFSHVIMIVFENREFGSVVAHGDMPVFNQYADQYSLLRQYYAIRHPSLPNYIAMISGDVQGIGSDCTQCFVDAPSLPDLLEKAGLSWRTYQEDMPEPCYLGSTRQYAQKHDPFIYFDAIRLNPDRCQQNIVPLTGLDKDLQNGQLPNFVFITPNMCNSGHDCYVSTVDEWIQLWVPRILQSPAFDERSLLVLTWDEGQGDHGCCGLSSEAGGRVATVLISDLVKPGFVDDTPYTHYSLLKTLSTGWGLSLLGHAADADTTLITAPWKQSAAPTPPS